MFLEIVHCIGVMHIYILYRLSSLLSISLRASFLSGVYTKLRSKFANFCRYLMQDPLS